MAAIIRSRRVFDAVFPPDESPFLSGFVRTDPLRPDQQRLWDIVTRILKPDFTFPFEQRNVVISEGMTL